jgi:hypothetical protein
MLRTVNQSKLPKKIAHFLKKYAGQASHFERFLQNFIG